MLACLCGFSFGSLSAEGSYPAWHRPENFPEVNLGGTPGGWSLIKNGKILTEESRLISWLLPLASRFAPESSYAFSRPFPRARRGGISFRRPQGPETGFFAGCTDHSTGLLCPERAPIKGALLNRLINP